MFKDKEDFRGYFWTEKRKALGKKFRASILGKKFFLTYGLSYGIIFFCGVSFFTDYYEYILTEREDSEVAEFNLTTS